MDDGSIQITNARQFRQAFTKAGGDKDLLKQAGHDVAETVANAGRATAPRLTGRLAGTVRGSGTVTGATVRAGSAAVPYANPIHWGWFRRHIAPDPWLSHAAQSTQTAWLASYEDAINQALTTIAEEAQ